MNDARRKTLYIARDLMDQAMTIISDCRDEEQDAFDAMPEGLQETERGEAMEENVSNMEDILDEIDRLMELLDEVTE